MAPWGGEPPPELPFDPEDNGRDEAEPLSGINNAVLAVMLFLGTDVMLFVALIGAFFVFRYGGTDWPPLGQPRLPITVTGINTLILLASGFTMLRALQTIRAGNVSGFLKRLMLTAGLGLTFLLIQGSEWLRLIGFGLTMSSSVYGSIFYTLIGCHALHVLGAVVWLVVVNFKAHRRHYTAENNIGVQLCAMYWFLVVGLWPVLFVVVYLK